MTVSIKIGRYELVRWIACGVLVVSAHAACALALVHWRDEIEPFDVSGAIVVELAQTPTSAAEAEPVIAPGPKQVQADAAPPPPEKAQDKPPEERRPDQTVAEAQPEQQVDLPVMADADAVLAALPPPPPLPTEPPQMEAATAVPMTTAPQVTAAPAARQTAAPVLGSPSAKPSNALPQWTSKISVLLERAKRYPKSAQSRREQGTTVVSFVLDRQGHLVSSAITASSGSPALDQEALELLSRAQPFPLLPAEVPGTQLTVSVPIRFALH